MEGEVESDREEFFIFEASYDNLPNLLQALVQRNVGTYFNIMDCPGSNKSDMRLM
jgi:hypothetical protein